MIMSLICICSCSWETHIFTTSVIPCWLFIRLVYTFYNNILKQFYKLAICAMSLKPLSLSITMPISCLVEIGSFKLHVYKVERASEKSSFTYSCIFLIVNLYSFFCDSCLEEAIMTSRIFGMQEKENMKSVACHPSLTRWN